MTFVVIVIVALLVVVVALAVGVRLVRDSLVRVPGDHVGIVHRRFALGHAAEPHRLRLQPSSVGTRAAVLGPNEIHLLPQWIYRVEMVPMVYVPTGTIGVVLALDGEAPSVDRSLARHVDCDNFQDGVAFLRKGGQQGRQPRVLPGGARYAINPALFQVVTTTNVGAEPHGLTLDDLHEISVPLGMTGVVVALEGEPPDPASPTGRAVDGHGSFQHPEVFLDNGGQRGAQAEVLPPGSIYRINPWFARVVMIPTRDITLEWRREARPEDRFDARLGPLRVNAEGYWLRFDMSQVIRIPAEAAPVLVGRFGEQERDTYGRSTGGDVAPVQRFVEKVLGQAVSGYFVGVASKYEVIDFIVDHREVRLELEDQVRAALADFGVEAVRTTLGEFEPDDPTIDELRRKMAAARDLLRADVAREPTRTELERLRIETERHAAQSEEIRIELDRKRKELEHVELQVKYDLLGKDAVALQLFLAELSRMNVPQYVGGNAGELLEHLPLAVASGLIERALRHDLGPVGAVAGGPGVTEVAEAAAAPEALHVKGWKPLRPPPGRDEAQDPSDAAAHDGAGRSADDDGSGRSAEADEGDHAAAAHDGAHRAAEAAGEGDHADAADNGAGRADHTDVPEQDAS